MSDIRSDQETGEGPVDPNTPAQSSEVPADEQGDQGQDQPKSPDESGEEAREGGGYASVPGEGGDEDDEK